MNSFDIKIKNAKIKEKISNQEDKIDDLRFDLNYILDLNQEVYKLVDDEKRYVYTVLNHLGFIFGKKTDHTYEYEYKINKLLIKNINYEIERAMRRLNKNINKLNKLEKKVEEI